VRILGPGDLAALRRLLDADPVTHCFLDSRVRIGGIDTWHLGGEIWGYERDGALLSALYLGANLVPIATTQEARVAFAERLTRVGRRNSSIVGPADEVLDLWSLLEPQWGPCRELRPNQPLLVMDAPSAVAPDPLVRYARRDELELIVPACVDMFTQEVGISPVAHGGGHVYTARIAELIGANRSIVRIDDGEVVFKAEIGAATPDACQVQGVWVSPNRRGEGLSVPAMAAVVGIALADIATTVSLYVNDYNAPARRAYANCGFREHGTFATVLF